MQGPVESWQSGNMSMQWPYEHQTHVHSDFAPEICSQNRAGRRLLMTNWDRTTDMPTKILFILVNINDTELQIVQLFSWVLRQHQTQGFLTECVSLYFLLRVTLMCIWNFRLFIFLEIYALCRSECENYTGDTKKVRVLNVIHGISLILK